MSNDKIKELALKLKALADKGVGGEKENAAEMLQRLMEKHGITLEDIEGEKKTKRIFIFDPLDKFARRLRLQIICNVIAEEYDIWFDKTRRKKKGQTDHIIVEMTDAQYIEISQKIDFYWKHLHDEMEIFYSAFVQTNALWKNGGKSKEPNELTPEEKEEIERILKMSDAMKQKSFHKQLKK